MHENLTRLDVVGPALARALGDPGWERLEASLVSGGKSNLTFELSSDAGEAVLRRPPDGPLLPRAHDMGREARIQRALAGTVVPVAKILFEDTGELIGVPFYVMEKIDGYVIRGDLPGGWAETAADRCAVGDVLIDTLADLHAIDPDEVGLTGYGRPSGLGERQVRRWSDQWERSKSRDIPAAEDASGRMWDFMREEVFPAEPQWAAYLREHGEHAYPPLMERLKSSARARGLWNLFLPAASGLTNVDYAAVAEISGWSPVIAPEAINCQAPDTGNMELLHMFGTEE